jgi:hypothetical protein
MKQLVFILLVLFSLEVFAGSIRFNSFSMSVSNDWEYEDSDGVTTISHPDGVGALQISSFKAPDTIGKSTLANLAEIKTDEQAGTAWQSWGDYSGYQLIYSEEKVFWRKWFLASGKSLVFITYNCDIKDKDKELALVDEMVESIVVN